MAPEILRGLFRSQMLARESLFEGFTYEESIMGSGKLQALSSDDDDDDF